MPPGCSSERPVADETASPRGGLVNPSGKDHPEGKRHAPQDRVDDAAHLVVGPDRHGDEADEEGREHEVPAVEVAPSRVEVEVDVEGDQIDDPHDDDDDTADEEHEAPVDPPSGRVLRLQALRLSCHGCGPLPI